MKTIYSLLVLLLVICYSTIVSSQKILSEEEIFGSSSNSNSAESNIQWYSITSDFQVLEGKVSNAIGYGYFKDEMSKDGWGKLMIEMTQPNYYAAGFLEGYLTNSYIYNFSVNYFTNYMNSTDPTLIPEPLVDFALANYAWMQSEFTNSSDPYSVAVNNVLNQFQGLVKGYQIAADSDKQLNELQLLLINFIGDLGDVVGYLEYMNSTKHTTTDLTLKELETIFATKGRCSALIRLKPDNSELYASHTTWGSYFTMLRIYKKLIIPDPMVANSQVFYSSYPGILTSDDDFSILQPSNLAIIETTNDILIPSLYSKVTYQSLLYWVRSVVANRLSNTGAEWVNNYVQYQSGTYNNQWQVIDYKLFKPSQPIVPNTLWIVETAPGYYQSQDVSQYLSSASFWASYNRPFFVEIQQLMGYTYYEQLYGNILSYDMNPRAMIFKRDQDNVNSLEGMQAIMTYNQYQTDPYSQGYPGNAIAARFDIESSATPPKPDSWFYLGIHGGIDSKIISYQLLNAGLQVAYSGPTHASSQTPPFTWIGTQWENVTRNGIPETFDFDWVVIDLPTSSS
ncbi:hypothetical protein CYY_005034 [Polysphondylium violaceum]|uniref:Phospholipase B-like n=1 Tax=Polysphondylium violaceum TaxID=133409 RepID=A0A8J4V774_9MYCE|nr:hypothetical protein CYY_005034 [Polysphondylium violaceum]